MGKHRIAVQVLNGATGDVREVVVNVVADSEQQAVDKLFAKGRRDDFYYRFLGMRGIVDPSGEHVSVQWENQKYWSLE